MVRRRTRSLRIPVVTAAFVIAFTAFVLWRAVDTRERPHPEPPLRPPPLPPGCPLPASTAGIDVSHHQGDIAWSRVRRAGIAFAFIRISDGETAADPKFATNWHDAKRAGVLRGAYQFFRPAEDPIAQATLVVRALRQHGLGELPPVLDIEVTGGLPLARVIANARVWIEYVRSQLGVEPIVYTNPGMWRWTSANELARQPLWVAHYTTSCPSVPPPWSRWTFWQYTDAGRIDGIDAAVDLDVFPGSVDELRRRFRR